MIKRELPPPLLRDRCRRWASELMPCGDNDARIAVMSRELPELLRDRDLFREILGNIADGAPYPDTGRATMFESEIILHRDPRGLFSVRMYLWGAGEYDPVHDHNSWGVIGPATGKLEVITYRRKDGGKGRKDGGIVECGRDIISPGQVYAVRPLDEGIHRTGNPTTKAIVQVGVYGPNLTGRSYVNRFDVVTGKVFPMYVPQTKKKILAQKVLSALNARD